MTTYLIGRQSDCDIVIEDPTVSRRHAELTVLGADRFVLSDSMSSGGSYVRDGAGWRRIERELLLAHDRIRLGGRETSVGELLSLLRAKRKPGRMRLERDPETGEIVPR